MAYCFAIICKLIDYKTRVEEKVTAGVFSVMPVFCDTFPGWHANHEQGSVLQIIDNHIYMKVYPALPPYKWRGKAGCVFVYS